MPYRPEHKVETRARIVECARELFVTRGFTEVSIDEIMAKAGLTRGGFYNHFKTKEDLYTEILVAFGERREDEAKNFSQNGSKLALQMVTTYVSCQHLDDIGGHCPLAALTSDVARAGPATRAAYRRVLECLVQLFEANLGVGNGMSTRDRGLAMAATCVGAMVLARTIDDPEMADEICHAARAFASDQIN